MLSQSTAFMQAFASDTRTLGIKITVGDKSFTAQDLNTLDYNSASMTGDQLGIGSTYENSITIAFANLVEGIKALDKVTVQMGIQLPDGTFEYAPLGVFYVDDEIQMDRNNNLTTITAVDSMSFLEGIYDHSSQMVFPTNLTAVLLDIANQAGVKLNQANFGALPTITINTMPKGQTYRTILGELAALIPGYATFNRSGELCLKSITDGGQFTISPSEYEFQGLTKNENNYTVSGMMVSPLTDTNTDNTSTDTDNTSTDTNNSDTDTGAQKTITVGDSTGNQVVLQNDFIDADNLARIWKVIQPLNYYPYSLNWFGNPAIEAGDWLTVSDTTGNTFIVPNNTYTMNFDGGLSAVSGTDETVASPTSWSAQGSINQVVKQIIQNTNATGTFTFNSVTQPGNPQEGDLWFKPNNNTHSTELYIYQKGQWMELASDLTGTQIAQKVTDAQNSANSALTDAQNALSQANTAISNAKTANDNANNIIFDNRNFIAPAYWESINQIGMLTMNGTILTNSNSVYSDYISTNSKVAYFTIVKVPSSGLCNIAFYDSSKTFISYQALENSTNITIPSNCAYIRLSVPINSLGGQFKFEFSSKPTSYAPAPEDINLQISDAQNEADTANSSISSVQSDLKTISDKATQNGTDISTIKSDVSQNKTDIANTKGDVSQLQQTATSLKANVTNSKNDISDLQQTATSLKSSLETANGDISTLQQTASGINSTVTSISNDLTNTGIIANLWATSKLSAGSISSADGSMYSNNGFYYCDYQIIQDTANLTITFYSPKATVSLKSTAFAFYNANKTFISGLGSNGTASVVQNGSNYYWTVAVPANAVYFRASVFYNNNGVNNISDIQNNRVKIEKGTVSHDWSMSPQDSANQTDVSALSQTISGLQTTVSSNSSDISTLKQTATTLQTQVNGKVDNATYQSDLTQTNSAIQAKVSTSDYNSKITQLSNDINLKVAKGDVVSQINIEANQTLIDTGKLVLNAASVVFGGSAFIPDAAITDLSANKLTAGTIDASIINVINMNASQISTGILKGSNLSLNLNTGNISSGSSSGNYININNGNLIYSDGNNNSWGVLTLGTAWSSYNQYIGMLSKEGIAFQYTTDLTASFNPTNGHPYELIGSNNFAISSGDFTYSYNQLHGAGLFTDTSGTDLNSNGNDLILSALQHTNGFTKSVIDLNPSPTTGIGLYGTQVTNDTNNPATVPVNVALTGTLRVTQTVDATKGITVNGSTLGNVQSGMITPSLQMAGNWIGDAGSSITTVTGRVTISLDSNFASLINTSSYLVFVQPKDDTGNQVAVTNKRTSSFTVASEKGSCLFDWMVIGKRLGHENERLVKVS